ncbi:RING-H2 finger protein ATL5 [Acorus gramineus]|uniref:RING-type E3 ubiquitin transferase n=1 Tax=Acorus gramineus TaxID=55184 RepID=A0AAV9BH05_ACOGR|nr:RING-H2 finger protein ATL5 [Acorus gramineus]
MSTLYPMYSDCRNCQNQDSFNNRIMITAVLSLAFVVVFVFVLHLYARRIAARRSTSTTGRRPSPGLRSTSLQAWIMQSQDQQQQSQVGLDPSVIGSLPVFTYKHVGDESGSIDCPVCLSSFEEGELARVLTNCGHVFHVECIDMWLHTHSTCPVCRTEARPVEQSRADDEVGTSGAGGGGGGQGLKTAAVAGGTFSRLSSLRRMLSRGRSGRVRSLDDGVAPAAEEDLERQ